MNDETPVKPLFRELISRHQMQESTEYEFKMASRGLPKSLWETVSAFANTNGGWILLGVTDAHPPKIVGVPNAHKQLEEFYSLINDPTKISYRACGPNDAEIDSADGTDLIVIRVPAAPLKERPIYIHDNPFKGTYRRGHSGDFLCSRSDVLRMMREASETSADSTILYYLQLEDLEQRTLREYRQRFQNADPDSPFNAYDDMSFLRAIDAYRVDRETDKSGITIAGLLLLGRSQPIRQWRSRHQIDYRQMSDNDSWDYRWDDRVLFEGNLLDAFNTIYPRLTADLPVPFRLEGPIRASESPIHVALREALVNLLVHADYSETRASLIIRSPKGFIFRNPGVSRVPASELGFNPDSDARNPILVSMLRYIGLADEAGSGMAKIFGAWRESQFYRPMIDVNTERYEFRIVMPYLHLLSDEDLHWLGMLGEYWTEAEQMALLHAKHEQYVDNSSLCALTGIHSADATKVLGKLRDQGLLTMSGRARGARYELAEQARSALDRSIPSAGSTNIEDTGLNLEDSDGYLQDNWDQLTAIAQPARTQARLPTADLDKIILATCAIVPLSISDIAAVVSRSEAHIMERVRSLRKTGRLQYLHMESPRHPRQRYVAIEGTKE